MTSHQFDVSIEDRIRLDQFLCQHVADLSRTKAKDLCNEGLVKVNEVVRKGSFLLNSGDSVILTALPESAPATIVAEDIPLDVLYEDDHIAVLNKQAGLVVHPGRGNWQHTLVHALKHRFSSLSSLGGESRLGIVHRLDKGTSGVMVIAKTDQAHMDLTHQWQAGSVTKVYQALVWGTPEPQKGSIETHITRHRRDRTRMAVSDSPGKWATTRYKVVTTLPEACRINVHILTGRTHQIRVHMAHIGHHVVGDKVYGGKWHKNLCQSFHEMPDRPMLHAALLRFRHPHNNNEVQYEQERPHDMITCEENLQGYPY